MSIGEGHIVFKTPTAYLEISQEDFNTMLEMYELITNNYYHSDFCVSDERGKVLVGNLKPSKMSKRAEIAQANAKLPESIISYAKEHTVMAGLVYREGVKLGYEQAEKDIIERACKWLFRHYAVNLIEFRKAMEEES